MHTKRTVSLARHAIFSPQRSSELKGVRSPKTHIGQKFESLNFIKKKNLELEENSIYDIMNGSCVSTITFLQPRRLRGDNRFLCVRDIIRYICDALENHEENKNKDLSSTICEYVRLECTPQVRYN